MKEYLFYDEVSGEEFLVETDMKEKAYMCAYAYFEEPKFIREVSHWEAEMLGLDTYQKGENKMAKCKNCNSEDYEIIYIEEYDYNGDYIRVLAKARCCGCGKEFWVREYFDFDDSKNVQGKI